ncbi:hypothetical protein DR66_4472 [Delftia acidovorans]|jgi:hypothetical protein|uniref:Uncharacterized protein n=5 Tax=Pseudomonadati TaxID=3379134 RepID=A9BX16_DELAS|nr:conserved hypothetical protein [Delftia acidovorans SPH-1]APE49879.1 hypothetical protein BO996_19620 [Delftia sp. HK171]ATH16011.1 hypothetical protein CHL79_28160 [Delftia acidovorans]MBB1649090.1 hypothetical protein [Delftia sp. UME58]MCP4015464.1 hypothetical protein [Delftia sp.]OLE06864.1 MAG: hypothetical protein AUG53_12965 [Delftia sp. 13_1_20CM_4_67_18]
MSMDMRRVLLIPASARPVDPGLASLSMDAQVWENGYPLVVGKARHGLLQDFWRHYYGESAAMFVAADQLLELHNDIMAAIPACVGEMPVLRFLNDLGRMCLQAHGDGSGLQVIGD